MSPRALVFLAVPLLMTLSGCTDLFTPQDDETPAGIEIVLQSLDEEDGTYRFAYQVSGGTGSSTHVGAHWSDTSTADRSASTLVPGDFDGATDHLASFTFPGRYETTWTPPGDGTYYVRGHMALGEAHHWSDERVVTVGAATTTTSPSATTPTTSPSATTTTTSPSPTNTNEPTTHTVTIEDPTPVTCDTSAPFDPDPISIAVGDSIRWTNSDDCAHTATADDGSFDTGNIASGATSSAIAFSTAGTFTYKCAYHPAMTGTVQVE